MGSTDQDDTTTRDRDLASGSQKADPEVTPAVHKAVPVSQLTETPGHKQTSSPTPLRRPSTERGTTGPGLGPWAGSYGALARLGFSSPLS